jgi:hypothetical protein
MEARDFARSQASGVVGENIYRTPEGIFKHCRKSSEDNLVTHQRMHPLRIRSRTYEVDTMIKVI